MVKPFVDVCVDLLLELQVRIVELLTDSASVDCIKVKLLDCPDFVVISPPKVLGVLFGVLCQELQMFCEIFSGFEAVCVDIRHRWHESIHVSARIYDRDDIRVP